MKRPGDVILAIVLVVAFVTVCVSIGMDKVKNTQEYRYGLIATKQIRKCELVLPRNQVCITYAKPREESKE